MTRPSPLKEVHSKEDKGVTGSHYRAHRVHMPMIASRPRKPMKGSARPLGVIIPFSRISHRKIVMMPMALIG